MASPELPYDTYRLTGIPSHLGLQDVKDLLSVEDKDALFATSLAPALLPHYKDTRIATITLKSKSSALRAAIDAGYLQSNEDGPRIGIDNDFYGFTPLNDVTENEKTVDVIAVTGLAGRAFSSWQYRDGHMWLRDFLPRDVASCRVMIFGYPSQLFKSISEAGLFEYTNYFLQQLDNIRPADSNRPLILVGHSLGCLIIKHAFCMPSIDHVRGLSQFIHSVFFFGAPHRGLNTKALELLVNEDPKENLIRDLREDSSLLQILNHLFPKVAKHLRIVSVYECQHTPTTVRLPDGSWARVGEPAMAVKENSACLSMENEELVAVDQNHSMIAKLSPDLGSVYHTVVKYMTEYAQAAPAATRQRVHEAPTLTSFERLNITDPSASFKFICNTLPQPHRNFLGRDSLLRNLRNALYQPKVKLSTMILHGIGGGGKSQIARQYVRSYQNDYHAVFWVNFRSQMGIEQGFSEAAESIKELCGRDIKPDCINYVKSWLERYRHRWLLILDNVDDRELASGLENKYLPTRGNGEIIITTRNRELAGIGYELDVPSLDHGDAAELLLRTTGQGAQALSEALGISQLLGGHPLAIAQAGAYIKTLRTPMARYMNIYEKQRAELLSYKIPLQPDEQTAATTFEISFENLKKNKPNAAMLLLLFSFLDRSISFEILQYAFDSRSSSDDEYSELPQWLLSTATANGEWDDGITLYKHAAALHNLSLIDIPIESGIHAVCSIHPVVQEWSHIRLSIDEQQYFASLAIQFIHQCSLRLQEDLTTDRSGAFVKQKPLLLHMDSCLENSRRYLTKPRFLGGPTSRKAALRFSHLLWYNGDWERAQMLQQRVLDTLPNDDPLFIEATLALCSTLRKRGEFAEATELQEKVGPLVKSPTQRYRLLGEMADTYRDQNLLAEACKIRQAILEVLKLNEGEDSLLTVNAKGALAVIYYKFGRYDEAVLLEDQVLQQRKGLCGNSHPDTLTAMANLAGTYYGQRDYERAEELERKVLDQRRDVLGDDLWDTIRAKGSLGATLRQLGKFDEAVSLLDETLRGKIARVGAGNLSSQRTYGLLHKTLCEMNNNEAAEKLETSFGLAKLSS